MSLLQLIYTSTCTDAMTPKMAYQVSNQSVKVCEELRLTGRVFANHEHAFFVMEGEAEVVRRFYKATEEDVLTASMCLLSERDIQTREFNDYSVWLNIPEGSYAEDNVYLLTTENVKGAIPTALSSHPRIMTEAYLSAKIIGRQAS